MGNLAGKKKSMNFGEFCGSLGAGTGIWPKKVHFVAGNAWK